MSYGTLTEFILTENCLIDLLFFSLSPDFLLFCLTHSRHSVNINSMNNHGNEVTQSNSPFLLKRNDRISGCRRMDIRKRYSDALQIYVFIDILLN